MEKSHVFNENAGTKSVIFNFYPMNSGLRCLTLTFLNSFQFTSTYCDCYEPPLWPSEPAKIFQTSVGHKFMLTTKWCGREPRAARPKPADDLSRWRNLIKNSAPRQRHFCRQVSDGTSVYVQETKEHLFELELLSERRKLCDAATQPQSPLWGGVRVFG